MTQPAIQRVHDLLLRNGVYLQCSVGPPQTLSVRFRSRGREESLTLHRSPGKARSQVTETVKSVLSSFTNAPEEQKQRETCICNYSSSDNRALISLPYRMCGRQILQKAWTWLWQQLLPSAAVLPPSYELKRVSLDGSAEQGLIIPVFPVKRRQADEQSCHPPAAPAHSLRELYHGSDVSCRH